VASGTAADARNWALGVGLALLVHGAGVGALGHVKGAWVAPPAPPVELEIREPPPAPPPEAPREPPPPLPQVVEPPKPRPIVARHAPVVRALPPPAQPPPPNQQPTAETPKSAPPVFGVTMSSVVSGESGMAVPVGNTLMVKPTAAPKSNQAPQPYAAGPVGPEPFRPVPEAYIATKPRVLYEVNSADVYPPDALALGLEGGVNLSVGLNEKGAVVEVRVLKRAGHKFDEAAMQALRKFRFSPALTSDGRAVPTRITYSFKFSLGN
jgi:protein TonB